MIITTYLLPALSLGFSASMLPGPLQAYIINTTLNYGWRLGSLMSLAPLIVDVPIIILMVFVLGQMPVWAIQMIQICGGLLLLKLAWDAWKSYQAGAEIEAGETDLSIHIPPKRQLFANVIMMNFLSPGPYLFWGTVTGPILIQALNESVLHGLLFIIGFYGSFIGCLNLIVYLFHRLGNLSPRVSNLIIMISIIVLLLYGTGLITDALGLWQFHRIIWGLILILGIGYQLIQRVYKQNLKRDLNQT
ncbi:hypothetical protein MASR2M15_27600 [Anaerolineales bacterium]